MSAPQHHLLSCEDLTREEIEAFFERAEHFSRSVLPAGASEALKGKAVALSFFENSTRTRLSFERAAKALGADVLNFNAQSSSVAKGETLLDTVRNVDAMGVRAIVLRHASSGAAAQVARETRCAVINAGDGTHEHPSQGLLDAFTLHRRFGTLEKKVVAIVGDVLHSRVARSNLHCLRKLGAEVVLCGPPTLLPKGLEGDGCRVTTRFDPVLEAADAVMMLRVQLERQTDSHFPSAKEYARHYGLNAERARRMKAGAVVMHPGPINRGVELSSDVADGQSSVILEQVTNGVAMRMAILERCG